MSFSAEHKQILIAIARDEIHSHLLPGGKHKTTDREIPAELKTKCGAFVSLYVDGKLRGCIGTFSEDDPLFRNIRGMALSAALHDSRFTPIGAEETDQMKIEISVLSPRKSIEGPDEIEIGRHGIYIQQGMKRGTLLPQVAVSQQWNVIEFLENCSRYKAGIGIDGWRSAELYTYEATVFDSEDCAHNC
ncbi:MAG: AmmeMemoRadiSam system protein A [Bacteroidetes bacterium]|nr:AmmeMemoRadiSam system protein A [Bacteroidota bacterium]